MIPAAYVVVLSVYLAAGGPVTLPVGVAHGLVMVASLVLLVRSIVHIQRNTRLNSDQKITWILLSLLVGFISLPVYWLVIAQRPNGTSNPTADTAPA